MALAVLGLFVLPSGTDVALAGPLQNNQQVITITKNVMVSTTWGTTDTTYVLKGDIIVSPTVVLTIEEGVVVKGYYESANYASLEVQGHLSALGTASQPITFTSAQDSGAGQWEGLKFEGGEGGYGGTGYLRYVTVRYAGSTVRSNVDIQNVMTGAVKIESSRIFSVASGASTEDHGVYIKNSNVILSDTMFVDNGDGITDRGLFAEGDSALTVTHVTFQDNRGYPMEVHGDSIRQLIHNSFEGNTVNRVLIVGGLTYGDLSADGVIGPGIGLEGYELESTLTVEPEATLVILPGTTLMGVGTTAQLFVAGILSAEGESTHPITFTSESEWSGLKFSGSGDNPGVGNLTYINVQYGAKNLWLESGSHVTLTHSSVYSTTGSSNPYGIYVYNSVLKMVNVTVNNAKAHGLYVNSLSGDARVNVQDSRFLYNQDDGLRAKGSGTVVTVTNSFMEHNQDYGLYTENGALLWLSDSQCNDNGAYPLRTEGHNLYHALEGNSFTGNTPDRLLTLDRSSGDKTWYGSVTFYNDNGLDAYELEGDLTVSSDVTLTVEPGVTIIGRSGAGLWVDGGLDAQGEEGKLVVFTSEGNSPGGWAGLYFDGSADKKGQGYLHHTVVRYGATSLNDANIYIREGSLQLEHSQVLSAGVASDDDYGIYADSSQLIISATLFANNGDDSAMDYALYVLDGGTLTVMNSEFRDNIGYAIYADASSLRQIVGNTYRNNGFDSRVLIGKRGNFAESYKMGTDTMLGQGDGLAGYEFEDSATVLENVTLTVQPGVTVMGREDTGLMFEGHLAAYGTAANPITFTAVVTMWGGLRFQSAQSQGVLEHVVLRAGGDRLAGDGLGDEPCVGVTSGANVTITQSTIEDSVNYGVYVADSTLAVFQGTLRNNQGYGLYATANSTVTVQDSDLSGNSCGVCVDDAATLLNVTYSDFTGNAVYPMHVMPQQVSNLNHNTFSGNALDRVLISGDTLNTDGNWPNSNQPAVYELEGDVEVGAGFNLVVQPGVTVMGREDTGLMFEGDLTAYGTEGQPITFTTVVTRWGGLRFQGAQSRAMLEHVTVQGGGDHLSVDGFGKESCVGVSAGANVTMTHGAVASSTNYGLYVADSTLVLSGTTVHQHASYGLYADASAALQVQRNHFLANSVHPLRVEANHVQDLVDNTLENNNPDRVLVDGGTVVSDGAWPNSNRPAIYELQDDVTVNQGVTLTVQPSVTVMGAFDSTGRGMLIRGTLKAIGIISHPITFTSVTTAGWRGLYFSGDQGGGQGYLRHSVVEHGGKDISYRANIYLVNGADVEIWDSDILSATRLNRTDYGLYAKDSRVVVSGTYFMGNGDALEDRGLYADNTIVTLTHAVFRDNAGYPVELTADSLGGSLVGNTFEGNHPNRVSIKPGSLRSNVTLEPGDGLEGYELKGAVTVGSGYTLTMQPAAVLLGNGGLTGLTVLGHLAAVGTETSPVTLTAVVSHTGWRGVHFDGGTGYLCHTNVFHGGATSNYGILVEDVVSGSVCIEDSMIAYTAGDYGLEIDNSRVRVSRTAFVENGETTADYGLYAKNNSAITVTHSVFRDNVGYSIGTYADSMRWLTDNVFEGNGSDYVQVTAPNIFFPTYMYDDATLGPGVGLAGYELKAKVIITENATLNLLSGAKIVGSTTNKGLSVEAGNLRALGTRTQPITFTAKITSPGQWIGLRFAGERSAGVLDHAVIQYGGNRDAGVGANLVVLSGANVTVTGSLIEEGGGTLGGNGIHVVSSTLSLACVTVRNHEGDGIYLAGDVDGFVSRSSAIYGNNGLGLRNTTTTTVVSMPQHWWGDPRGPYHPTLNPESVGDEISDYVSFSSPLSKEMCLVCDLVVAKADNPDPVLAGTTLTYTLTITNQGPADATDLRLVDDLPSDIIFYKYMAQQGTCDAQGGTQSVTCDLGTLLEDETVTVTLVTDVAPSAKGRYVNEATASSSKQELVSADNVASQPTNVIQEADLGVAKVDVPDPAPPGGVLVYTVVITNHGPSQATGVRFTDTLSSKVRFVEAEGCVQPDLPTATHVICDLPSSLDPHLTALVNLTVTVVPTAEGQIANTVWVSSTKADPQAANNITTATTVIAEADLGLSKYDALDPVLTGETLTYTLVVTNAGPTLSADVVLTDPLPAGVIFLRAVPDYCEGQSPVICKLGTVGVDEVVTITLGTRVASTARGLLVNTASVAGTARDRIPQNNIMTVTTSVDTEADLAVSKMSSSDPVTAGKSLVYTFTVMNNGPSAATDVSITDTLPSGVTLITVPSGCALTSGGARVPNRVLNEYLVCRLTALPLDASRTFTFSAKVDPETRGVLTNTVRATANEVDRTPAVVVQTTTVTSVVDLALAKTVTTSGAVLVGSPLTYTLIVTNAGPSAAMDVKLRDELPESLIYARSERPDGGECIQAAGVITCDIGTLHPRSEAMVTLVITSAATGWVSNTAYVQAHELDLTSSDNAAAASIVGTDCVPISAIRLSQTPAGDLFTGNQVRFSVDVLELEASSPFTYTWMLDDDLVEHSLGILDYTFTTPGSHAVSVTVANACSQDQAMLSVSVQDPEPGQPDLSGSYKSASLRYVEQGDHVTYTLFLRNQDDVTATATLVDPIPMSITYVQGSVWSSSESPATFDAGNGEIRWSGQIISGTPVVIRFAAEISDVSPGMQIENVATLKDEAYGNTIELAAYSVCAPGYGMSIQDGALYTRIPTVALRLWWDDPMISDMYISNDGGFKSGTGWIPVDATYSDWALATYGDTLIPRMVYAKFRDNYGRQYATVQDDIIYDPNPPRIERLEFIPGAQNIQALKVESGNRGIVRVRASDDNSGAARVQVSHNASFTPDSQVSGWYLMSSGAGDIPWTLQATGEVYIRVEDWAGNFTTASHTFALQFDVYLPLVLKDIG
jgi:uncharacterized repeat protein (TIGR01451 family)